MFWFIVLIVVFLLFTPTVVVVQPQVEVEIKWPPWPDNERTDWRE